jgi:hypothetical protein
MFSAQSVCPLIYRYHILYSIRTLLVQNNQLQWITQLSATMNALDDPPLLHHHVAPVQTFRNEKLLAKYRPHMIQFMNFFHNRTDYDKDSNWSVDVLASIRPEDIVNHFSVYAFGTVAPTAKTKATRRVDTVEYKKKAISFFMVNKTTKWNEIQLTGNPTMSPHVAEFMKFIKKQQVRRRGAKSRKCRAMTVEEFILMLKKLNAFRNERNPRQTIEHRFMIPALLKVQFHLVGRVDDMFHFLEEDLKVHPEFPFALQAQFHWSKNIMDERQTPNQIVLGSMDPNFCVLLALAIFLETWYKHDYGLSNQFLFGSGTDDSADNNKRAASRFLQNKIWKVSPEFKETKAGIIGTHSVRKFTSTYARCKGCQRDDIAHRGRWKDARKIVDIYIDNYLPYQDAFVAQTLCVGGACSYVLDCELGITDDWLWQHVVPNMMRSPYIAQCPRVAAVLALPLLWACFDANMEEYMPTSIRADVRRAYAGIGTTNMSPVTKTLLIVSGSDATLHIDPLFQEMNDANGNIGVANNPNMVNPAMTHQTNATMQAIYSQVVSLRHDIQGQFTSIDQRFNHLETRVNVVNRNVQQIALQPAQRRRATGPTVAGAVAEGINQNTAEPGEDGEREGLDPQATLSSRPSTLSVLWREYEHGIGNRKPAKDFTPAERGRCAKTYYRRNLVWQKLELLVRAGHSYEVACNMLQMQYGANRCVTEIIKRIIAEQPRAGRNTGRNAVT